MLTAAYIVCIAVFRSRLLRGSKLLLRAPTFLGATPKLSPISHMPSRFPLPPGGSHQPPPVSAAPMQILDHLTANGWIALTPPIKNLTAADSKAIETHITGAEK